MTKICLLGFGGMGQAVEKAARERKHEVVIVDPSHESAEYKNIREVDLSTVDVVIDVSSGAAVLDNVKACVEA